MLVKHKKHLDKLLIWSPGTYIMLNWSRQNRLNEKSTNHNKKFFEDSTILRSKYLVNVWIFEWIFSICIREPHLHEISLHHENKISSLSNHLCHACWPKHSCRDPKNILMHLHLCHKLFFHVLTSLLDRKWYQGIQLDASNPIHSKRYISLSHSESFHRQP